MTRLRRSIVVRAPVRRRSSTGPQGADLLLPNAQEAEALTGEADPRRAARALAGALRRGGGDARARRARCGPTAPSVLRVPAEPVEAVTDSTGAGDAFAAGLPQRAAGRGIDGGGAGGGLQAGRAGGDSVRSAAGRRATSDRAVPQVIPMPAHFLRHPAGARSSPLPQCPPFARSRRGRGDPRTRPALQLRQLPPSPPDRRQPGPTGASRSPPRPSSAPPGTPRARRSTVSGAAPALEARVQVREPGVVGLEGLEAADLVAARRPRARRSPTAPCSGPARRSSSGGPGRGSGSPPPSGPPHGRPRTARRLGVVDAGDDRVGVESGHGRQHGAQVARRRRARAGVVNWSSWSARSAASPSAGSSSRAATIARQARDVPAIRGLRSKLNGMPKRAEKRCCVVDQRGPACSRAARTPRRTRSARSARAATRSGRRSAIGAARGRAGTNTPTDRPDR